MREEFSQIYDNHVWFNGSGSGSAPANTVLYRAFLQAYLKTHGIKRVVDAGCGDWQSTRLIDWTGIDYVGLDVVPSVIAANTAKWGSANVRFVASDFSREPLPDGDLLIVKDVLQHWPKAVIKAFWRQVERFPRALITNASGGLAQNIDIKVGEARPLDLAIDPYHWPGREVLHYESWRLHQRTWETKSVFEIRQ